MFTQAITTKYLGPTNVRGARVKATAAAGSIILGWDHSLSIERNHSTAAQALATKFKWAGDWYGGGLADSGFVFVCVNCPHKAYAGNFTIERSA